MSFVWRCEPRAVNCWWGPPESIHLPRFVPQWVRHVYTWSEWNMEITHQRTRLGLWIKYINGRSTFVSFSWARSHERKVLSVRACGNVDENDIIIWSTSRRCLVLARLSRAPHTLSLRRTLHYTPLCNLISLTSSLQQNYITPRITISHTPHIQASPRYFV